MLRMMQLLLFVVVPDIAYAGNSSPSMPGGEQLYQIPTKPSSETLVRYFKPSSTGNNYDLPQSENQQDGRTHATGYDYSKPHQPPSAANWEYDRSLLSRGYPLSFPSGPSGAYDWQPNHEEYSKLPAGYQSNALQYHGSGASGAYGYHQVHPESADHDQTGPGGISQQVDVINYVPVPVVKKVHVPYPNPVRIPISQAVIIPISKPVPIHIPVPQQVQVPVEKELKIPVERVVPYPVEKQIPVPVEKHVPYPVIKYLPVRVQKPYPIKVPLVKTVVHKVRGWW